MELRGKGDKPGHGMMEKGQKAVARKAGRLYIESNNYERPRRPAMWNNRLWRQREKGSYHHLGAGFPGFISFSLTRAQSQGERLCQNLSG